MPLPTQSGVYKITCSVTGKVYVGSSLNVYRRWHAYHLPRLRRGAHINRYLQNAWNKYGEQAFICSLLETTTAELLTSREQFWMDSLQSVNRQYGFNLYPFARSALGVKHSRAACRRRRLVLAKTYIVRSPAGEERTIRNLYRFCRQRNLTHTAMSRVATGKASHHKNWECRHAGVSRKEWLAALTTQRRVKVVVGTKKLCSRCKVPKPRRAFNKDTQTSTGLAAYCRDCNGKRLTAAYRRRVA